MSSKWFEEQIPRLVMAGFTTWESQVAALAKEFVPEGDRDVLSAEQFYVKNEIAWGMLVDADDFKTLAEKFLLACCYIKELEAHNAVQEKQNNELFDLVKEIRETVEAAQENVKTARNLLFEPSEPQALVNSTKIRRYQADQKSKTNKKIELKEGPQIVGAGFFVTIVCAPKDMEDSQIELFANSVNPSGLARGWRISTDDDARCKCQECENKVHVKLYC